MKSSKTTNRPPSLSTDGSRSFPNLLEALRPQHLLPNLGTGLVLSLSNIIFALSFGALVFSGPLSDYASVGIGLALFAAMVNVVAIALFTSQPKMVGQIQEAPAIVLGLIAGSIGARTFASTEAQLSTVIVAIALTTLLTGAVCFLLGFFQLGNLTRFLPYPIIGGFLAATGWFIVLGGLGLMTSLPLHTPIQLLQLLQMDVLRRWVPGLLFALLLLTITQRFRSVLTLPLAMLTAVLLFHSIRFFSGIPLETAMNEGWLLGPFSSDKIWQPITLQMLAQTNWTYIAGEASTILTTILLTLITILLNVSRIELALAEDMNLNRELQAAGIANVFGGLGGGIIGFHGIGSTLFRAKVGGSSRIVQLFMALLIGATMVGGAGAISTIPRLALGGIVLFLGLELLWKWVWIAHHQLSRSDYLIVLLILVLAASVGYLPSIAVGLGVAIALFIFNYSRIPFARHIRSGSTYLSNMSRPLTQERLLKQEGDQLYILELQGFLFFGTAHAMLTQIRQRATQEGNPLRFVLLDFRLVTGLDSSAVISFTRMQQVAQQQSFQLIFTNLSLAIEHQLRQSGILDENSRLFPDLERGLAWCEETILTGALWRRRRSLPLSLQLDDLFPTSEQASVFIKHLQAMDVEANTVLFRAGDPPGPIYFVESGMLSVLLELGGGRNKRIQAVSDGAVLGDISFCAEVPQDVTVIADKNSTLHLLSQSAWQTIQQESPEAAIAFQRFLIRRLSDRISRANEEIKALLQ